MGKGYVDSDADVASGDQLACKTVKTSAAQDKAMQKAIDDAIANPGGYDLVTNNCTSFVREVLRAAGIHMLYPNPTPTGTFSDLSFGLYLNSGGP